MSECPTQRAIILREVDSYYKEEVEQEDDCIGEGDDFGEDAEDITWIGMSPPNYACQQCANRRGLANKKRVMNLAHSKNLPEYYDDNGGYKFFIYAKNTNSLQEREDDTV